MSPGGCAFNVAKALQNYKSRFVLCSPVGTGIYGDYIKAKLKENKIPVFARSAEENGACWCLVNAKNEHAFICAHKAEYVFDRKNYSKIDWTKVDSVYFCGLEMEEETSADEIEFLHEKKAEAQERGQKIEFYFDPSARISFIKKSLVRRILALSPVLHLNQNEAFVLTGLAGTSGTAGLVAPTEKNGEAEVQKAAAALSKKTGNDIIITRGALGSYIYEAEKKAGQSVPGFKAKIVNTIGCGDAHLGVCIAERKKGASLYDAVLEANRYAARIAETESAAL